MTTLFDPLQIGDIPLATRIGLGRLLVEQTMKLAHDRGCKLLDLSIGATDLKRRLGATTEIELFELNQPLSKIGSALAAYQRVRRTAAASSLLRTIKNRLRGVSDQKLQEEQSRL